MIISEIYIISGVKIENEIKKNWRENVFIMKSVVNVCRFQLTVINKKKYHFH